MPVHWIMKDTLGKKCLLGKLPMFVILSFIKPSILYGQTRKEQCHSFRGSKIYQKPDWLNEFKNYVCIDPLHWLPSLTKRAHMKGYHWLRVVHSTKSFLFFYLFFIIQRWWSWRHGQTIYCMCLRLVVTWTYVKVKDAYSIILSNSRSHSWSWPVQTQPNQFLVMKKKNEAIGEVKMKTIQRNYTIRTAETPVEDRPYRPYMLLNVLNMCMYVYTEM